MTLRWHPLGGGGVWAEDSTHRFEITPGGVLRIIPQQSTPTSSLHGTIRVAKRVADAYSTLGDAYRFDRAVDAAIRAAQPLPGEPGQG